MKAEEQRIAIAVGIGTHALKSWRLDGGTQTHITDNNGRIWNIVQYDEGMRTESKPLDFVPIPDFPADLNACHEMEKALSSVERFEFARELNDITGAGWVDEADNLFIVAHATAAQRCEAFLRVKGKWTGGDGE